MRTAFEGIIMTKDTKKYIMLFISIIIASIAKKQFELSWWQQGMMIMVMVPYINIIWTPEIKENK